MDVYTKITYIGMLGDLNKWCDPADVAKKYAPNDNPLKFIIGLVEFFNKIGLKYE
jgi:hypothetical protein